MTDSTNNCESQGPPIFQSLNAPTRPMKVEALEQDPLSEIIKILARQIVDDAYKEVRGK